jgi:hypothetical protein
MKLIKLRAKTNIAIEGGHIDQGAEFEMSESDASVLLSYDLVVKVEEKSPAAKQKPGN